MVQKQFPKISFEHEVLDNRQMIVTFKGKELFNRNAEGGFPHKGDKLTVFLEKLEAAM